MRIVKSNKWQFVKGQKPLEHKEGCKCFRCTGITWNKGKSWDEETIKKISKSKKGKKIWQGKRGQLEWMQGERHHAWKGGKPRCKTCGNRLAVYKSKTGLCFKCFRKRQIGKNHWLWKGNGVGSVALHSWVVRNLGKPDTCELCGKVGLNKHKIHWANKDHKYQRNLDDWLRLCSSCHKKYDYGNHLSNIGSRRGSILNKLNA